MDEIVTGPPCKGALNIAGEHFDCDWPTDASGKHDGWAHANKQAQAIWTAARPVEERKKLDIARSVADAVKAHGLRVLVGEFPAERPATAARCPWWTNGDSWALWAGPPSTLQCVLVSGHGGDHRATY